MPVQLILLLVVWQMKEGDLEMGVWSGGDAPGPDKASLLQAWSWVSARRGCCVPLLSLRSKLFLMHALFTDSSMSLTR
jgi:hypothetical protein